MSIKIKELHGSRNFAGGEDITIEFRWKIWNSDFTEVDHDDAQTAVEDWIDDEGVDPFVKCGFTFEPQLPATLEFDDNNHSVLATVRFVPTNALAQKGPFAPDPANISFNVAGESLHITQARDTRASYNSGGSITADALDVIGWDGQQIRGCDIVVPVLSFTIQWGVAIEDVDFAWVRNIANFVGRVNNNDMFDSAFAAGEVLFIGLQGSRNIPMERWDLSGTFLTSPNITGLALGPITGIAKLGFDYLDVTYTALEGGPDQPNVIPTPKRVDVRVVYDTADLNDLFT